MLQHVFRCLGATYVNGVKAEMDRQVAAAVINTAEGRTDNYIFTSVIRQGCPNDERTSGQSLFRLARASLGGINKVCTQKFGIFWNPPS